MTSTLVRCIARWLLAAMVFAALHPAAAAAAAWSSPEGAIVEVCTGQGMRWMSIDNHGSDQGDASPSVAQGEHCTLCRALADAPPDLGRHDLSFAAPSWLRYVGPQTPRLSDGTVRAVLTAPPRAPPARA